MDETVIIVTNEKEEEDKIKDCLTQKGCISILCREVRELVEKLCGTPDCGKNISWVVITSQMLRDIDNNTAHKLGDHSISVPFIILDSNNLDNSIQKFLSEDPKFLKRGLSQTHDNAFKVQCINFFWSATVGLLDMQNDRMAPQVINNIQSAAKETTDSAMKAGKPDIMAFAMKAADLLNAIRKSNQTVITESQKDYLFDLFENIKKRVLSIK